MKDNVMKNAAVFLCILFLQINISGCAGIKQEEFRYRDELIVETPIITPKVVRSGEKITQELQFTLLSALEIRQFNVSETVFISDGSDIIQLTKKESKKSRGIHKSIVQFVIPKDLRAGEYMLITTIRTENESKTAGGNFMVK